MPRPTAQDSTDALRGALRQLPDWFHTYEAKLREELGEHADHDRQAERLAEALQEAEAAWVRAKSLRRHQTYNRDDLMEDVQAFLGTAKIVLLRRFRRHPGRAKILEDFKNASPSTLRYPTQAQTALGHFLSALSVHGAALDELGKPVSAPWKAQATDLLQAFQAQHEAAEQAQHNYLQVQKHRDALKEQAAHLLRDAELAAQAVASPEEEVRWVLKHIFDRANPKKRKRKNPNQQDPTSDPTEAPEGSIQTPES